MKFTDKLRKKIEDSNKIVMTEKFLFNKKGSFSCNVLASTFEDLKIRIGGFSISSKWYKVFRFDTSFVIVIEKLPEYINGQLPAFSELYVDYKVLIK